MNQKSSKAKIATIIMFIGVALSIILFIVFFNIADGLKSTWNSYNASYIQAELDGNEEAMAKFAAYKDSVGIPHIVCAVLSYVFSIGAIVSLGVGLAVTDKIKLAEEKAAENS